MLPSKHRLNLRTQLSEVKKKGRLFHGPLFSLLVLKKKTDDPSLFGMIVSLKVSKKAVVRNLIRRRLGAAVLKLLPRLEKGCLVVFLAKKKLVGQDFQNIFRETESLFLKSGLLKK